MPTSRKPVVLPLLVALLFALPGLAGEPAPAPAAPVEVATGMYVKQIYTYSIKENSFTVDFYIWFRWKGDSLKPMDTFELANGRIEKKDVVDSKKLDSGENYAACRVMAVVTEFFDISRFPLDKHGLEIQIEDGTSEATKLKYVADDKNCGIDPKLQLPGYTVASGVAAVVDQAYKTNYGDTSLPSGNASTYSRFVYTINVERPDSKFFIKLFWSVFISVLIALLAFLVKPTDLDPRFGLGVGAIFAATASTYIISGYLPDTGALTMADKINFTAIAFIFGSLGQSVLSLKLATSGQEETSAKLDKGSFFAFLIAYIIANVIVVMTA